MATEILPDTILRGDRYNKDKLRWSLVDWKTLEGMVRVLEFGAAKYDVDNWKKGLLAKDILDSLMRHIVALQQGELVDLESNLSHADHIQCNAMFLSHMLAHRPDMNNLPNQNI